MTNSFPFSRIDEALQWATEQCSASDSARVDARVLLASVLDKPLSYLLTWPEASLDAEQSEQFVDRVLKRSQGIPVAHIIGFRDFWTLRLEVTPSTLIPRPETELLVEHALELALPTDAKVLDLGTGTGAIALALASERPRWQLTGVDRVEEAVLLARRNANLNQLSNVEFLLSHWFSGLTGQTFDLVITNPPYVETSSEYLCQGDVRFEPASALTSGADGLDDIRLIVEQAPAYLSDNGWLVIEHGFQQSQQVQRLMADKGFDAVTSVNDLNSHPRLTMGYKSH